MLPDKKDIITRLKNEILPLEGLRKPLNGNTDKLGLSFMAEAFPHRIFPQGVIHDFIHDGQEGKAASAGFISGLLGGLMKTGGAAVWISASRQIFPPALKAFHIEPDQLIFIHLHKEKDLLWVMEEAMKCEGLAAVVGELPDLSFTSSRRFQLAVEQSRVTGLFMRPFSGKMNNTAVARWKIDTMPSHVSEELPGLGFPCWNVELLKIRNGKPGNWQVEWSAGGFHQIKKTIPSIVHLPQRKTG